MLKTVKGISTRPTADRVKEAIFNVLGSRIIKAKVLDLFGGTGNIGLEALSRGAESVVFVEKNTQAMEVIKTNVKSCGFIEKVVLFKIDALRALKILKDKEFTFNIVYLDPPYRFTNIDKIIEELVNNFLLEPWAIVVVETSKNKDLIKEHKSLKFIKDKIYGDTKITYYQIGE